MAPSLPHTLQPVTRDLAPSAQALSLQVGGLTMDFKLSGIDVLHRQRLQCRMHGKCFSTSLNLYSTLDCLNGFLHMLMCKTYWGIGPQLHCKIQMPFVLSLWFLLVLVGLNDGVFFCNGKLSI
eukprot:1160012-Pelagomonas_calceolata.AAC.10